MKEELERVKTQYGFDDDHPCFMNGEMYDYYELQTMPNPQAIGSLAQAFVGSVLRPGDEDTEFYLYRTEMNARKDPFGDHFPAYRVTRASPNASKKSRRKREPELEDAIDARETAFIHAVTLHNARCEAPWKIDRFSLKDSYNGDDVNPCHGYYGYKYAGNDAAHADGAASEGASTNLPRLVIYSTMGNAKADGVSELCYISAVKEMNQKNNADRMRKIQTELTRARVARENEVLKGLLAREGTLADQLTNLRNQADARLIPIELFQKMKDDLVSTRRFETFSLASANDPNKIISEHTLDEILRDCAEMNILFTGKTVYSEVIAETTNHWHRTYGRSVTRARVACIARMENIIQAGGDKNSVEAHLQRYASERYPEKCLFDFARYRSGAANGATCSSRIDQFRASHPELQLSRDETKALLKLMCVAQSSGQVWIIFNDAANAGAFRSFPGEAPQKCISTRVVGVDRDRLDNLTNKDNIEFFQNAYPMVNVSAGQCA